MSVNATSGRSTAYLVVFSPGYRYPHLILDHKIHSSLGEIANKSSSRGSSKRITRTKKLIGITDSSFIHKTAAARRESKNLCIGSRCNIYVGKPQN